MDNTIPFPYCRSGSVLLFASFFSLMAIYPAALYAESLDEIIVSATRQMETVQQVPIALSVFTDDDLQKAGVDSYQDIQQFIPSLIYTSRVQSSSPYLRGIGTKLSLVGLEPSVATYVDDQYFSRPIGSLLELPDVERIEVLKGPQGTLFGRNAAGGAIRVITRSPGQNTEGEVNVSVGDYGYRAGSLYLSGGLTEMLAANVSVLKKSRDGFATNKMPGADDLDDLDLEVIRSKWVWQFLSHLQIEASVGYTHKKDSQGNATVNISRGGVASSDIPFFSSQGNRSGDSLDNVYNGYDDAVETDLLNGQLRATVEFAEFDLLLISSYQDMEARFGGDFDASSFVIADFNGEEAAETFTQEVQLQSTGEGDVQWLLGAFWFDSDSDQWAVLNRSSAGAPPAYFPRSELETTAWAGFGEVSYDVDERWSLTVGGRYSYEEKTIRSSTSGPTPLPSDNSVIMPAGIELGSGGDDWSDFTPKATLEYKATPDQLYYVSYAKGFKSGGYGFPYTGEAVDPEELTMYELGFKGDWLNRSLRFNSALYFYDYKNIQVNRNANAGSSGPVQILVESAGKAEILGLEADMQWQVNQGLNIMIGFNAMDSEFKDYDNATVNVWDSSSPPLVPIVSASPYDASGSSLPQVSELSAYMTMEYRFSMPNASLPLSLNYSYKQGYDYDLIAPNSALTSSQTTLDEMMGDDIKLMNLRLAYEPYDQPWQVALWVRNATDEEYYSEVVGFTTGVRASIGAPRTIGADINYRF